MSIKRIIKQLTTIVIHPIVSFLLLKKGIKSFYIAPQLTINGRGFYKYFQCGNNFSLGRNCRLLFVNKYQEINYTPIIKIGNNVSIGNRCSILSASEISIEDDCLIASDVLISSENHGLEVEKSNSYADTPLSTKEVYIGKGCWIGEKASILPGVVLGERCVVATNAVVTKSFPAYSMIAGIPAKVIKQYNFTTHRWESV